MRNLLAVLLLSIFSQSPSTLPHEPTRAAQPPTVMQQMTNQIQHRKHPPTTKEDQSDGAGETHDQPLDSIGRRGNTEPHIEWRKYVDGRVVGRFIVTEAAVPEIEALLRDKGFEQTNHGNCKAVIIWGDVDEEAYAERVRDHGATPLGDKKSFHSAREASLFFACNPNTVSQALKLARERGEDVAVVVGVPLRWRNSVGGDS